MIIGTERRLAIVISTIVLAGSISKAEQTQVKTVQSAVEAAVSATEYPWSAIGKLTNVGRDVGSRSQFHLKAFGAKSDPVSRCTSVTFSILRGIETLRRQRFLPASPI